MGLAALVIIIIISAGCGSATPTRGAAAGAPVAIGAGVRGPSGLTATVQRTGLTHLASLTVDPTGRIWAGTANDTDSGHDGVYLVGRGKAKPRAVLTDQHTVLGLLWYEESLYVASKGGVVAYSGFDGTTFAAHRTVVALPDGSGEVNDLVLSPGGRMLLGVSAPCDHCTAVPAESGAILSFEPDGTDLQTYASGIRAPVGLAIVPGTSAVLATMDQRDDLGAKTPGDWLAVVPQGSKWGFPDCYGQGGAPCQGVPRPLAVLDEHAAVSDVAVVTNQLGPTVGTAALVAEWTRGVVMRVPLSGGSAGKPDRLLTNIGKPVALALDGTTLLVGDWSTGMIYRIAAHAGG